ncbi:MAG: TolC family protein [Syntrophobacterales bacterium]
MRPVALLLCGVLLLSGCLLAPKYEREPETVPQEYRFQDLAGQPQPGLKSLADLTWWELFQDPVLQDLIRQALLANYDLRLAAARVAEARALVGVSRSAWLPQVGGAAIYQRERLSSISHPPAGIGFLATENLAQFNFDLLWEIDLFGRLRSLTKAAKAEFFASEWSRRAVLSAVIAEVARAYFELRTLDRQLEISRRTLKSYEDSLRLVSMRFERGVVSKQDVYQVKALVHTAGARIPDLERLIAQQEDRISILLGKNPQPIPRGKHWSRPARAGWRVRPGPRSVTGGGGSRGWRSRRTSRGAGSAERSCGPPRTRPPRTSGASTSRPVRGVPPRSASTGARATASTGSSRPASSV